MLISCITLLIDLVVSLPCCIPMLQVFNPPLFSFNMQMTSDRSQPRKQLEHRCLVCDFAFCPQAFSPYVQKCECLKKAEEGKNKYERDLQEVLLAKLPVHVILLCHSSIHLTLPLFSPKWVQGSGCKQ